ncbi:MAG: exopolyphosphatase [Acidimicrobiia bacterium]|nr:exopolyphosphatase [Acidimicrobiia bacterium]
MPPRPRGLAPRRGRRPRRPLGRRAARGDGRRPVRRSERLVNVAALDIGSNSVRLLVTGPGGTDLARESVIARLGYGVGNGGTLDPERVAATLECLRDHRARCDEHDVAALRAVATSAVRRASDGEAFLDAAEAVLGVRPEVIDGAEEGDLSFRGATSRLGPGEGPFVVIDLGGGSCEFAVGTASCDDVYSAEFGSARLTEAYVRHDPPAPDELVACLSVVEAHLDDVRRELPASLDARTFVGIGGTFTTFGAMEAADGEAVDGLRLSRAAAEDIYRTLVLDPFDVRVENPGLPRERAHVILGGACAVVAIMRGFGLDELVISERDILDGITADLAAASLS